MEARKRSRVLVGCVLMGLSQALGGCMAPEPTARELLDVLGDRRRPFHADPLQTFEAFRLAFRGRLYDLEYNCFSSGFKERGVDGQSIGQTTYREVRDQALGTFLVAWALWKAEVSPVEYLDDRRARLTAHYRGRTVEVGFVREDFWETWSGNQKVGDEFAPWGISTLGLGPDVPESSSYWHTEPTLMALLPLPHRSDYEALTELRVGQEWKIDSFQFLEDSAASL